MLPDYAHSLGGKKMAPILKKASIDRYYLNPNRCKQCDKVIEVKEGRKVSEIRQKKFCDQSCAAVYNNLQRSPLENRTQRTENVRLSRERKKLGIKAERKIGIAYNYMIGKTKGEIFGSHANWQSARTSIRRHAAHVYKTEIDKYKCDNCDYSHHVEICHIESVSSFSNETLISHINRKDNLVALCPNCHWEYDNGILKLRDREGVISPSS